MRIAAMPVIQEFPMESDPDKEAVVSFKQVKWGAAVKRGDLQAKRRQIFRDGDSSKEMVVEQDWNYLKQMEQEIYLSICGASGVYNRQGQESFKFKDVNGVPTIDMTESQFYAALAEHDESFVKELHKHALEVNVQWDPNRAGES